MTGIRWTPEQLAEYERRRGVHSKALEQRLAGKPAHSPRQLEAAEGRALIEWWDGNPKKGVPPACVRWDLDPRHLVHMPLGGARTKRAGAMLKAEGARAGFPDYILFVARQDFHGLVLELKHPDGQTPTKAQLDYLQLLQAAGWAVGVPYGWGPATRLIVAYLDGRAPPW